MFKDEQNFQPMTLHCKRGKQEWNIKQKEKKKKTGDHLKGPVTCHGLEKNKINMEEIVTLY